MVETFHPRTLAEARELRARHEAIPCAGGTDLFVKHRRGAGALPAFTRPVMLLDRCEELRGITTRDGHLEIGAMTTLAQLAESGAVHPSLRDASLQMGGPALRTVATIGGNVCNASPAGDSLPFLYAFQARVRLVGPDGERVMALSDFITGPGRTALGPRELLAAILVPDWQPGVALWRKVGTRRANALTKVSIAAFADREAGRMRHVRMALGAVGPTIIRLAAAEQLLEGAGPGDDARLVPLVREAAMRAVSPLDDQRSSADYRRTVAGNLVVAFVESALNAT